MGWRRLDFAPLLKCDQTGFQGVMRLCPALGLGLSAPLCVVQDRHVTVWAMAHGYWAVLMLGPAQGHREPQPTGARLERSNGCGDVRGEVMNWSGEGTSHRAIAAQGLEDTAGRRESENSLVRGLELPGLLF